MYMYWLLSPGSWYTLWTALVLLWTSSFCTSWQLLCFHSLVSVHTQKIHMHTLPKHPLHAMAYTHLHTHTHGTWHTHIHNYREQTLAYVPHYYTYWHGISTMYPHEYIPNARSGIHTAIVNNSLHSILCLWSRQQHSEWPRTWIHFNSGVCYNVTMHIVCLVINSYIIKSCLIVKT